MAKNKNVKGGGVVVCLEIIWPRTRGGLCSIPILFLHTEPSHCHCPHSPVYLFTFTWKADRETASICGFYYSGTGPLNTPFYIKDLNITGFLVFMELWNVTCRYQETLNGCVNLHSIWISVTCFKIMKWQKERSLSRQEEEKRNTV